MQNIIEILKSLPDVYWHSKEIAKSLDYPESRVRTYLSRLYQKGLVERDGRGGYRWKGKGKIDHRDPEAEVGFHRIEILRDVTAEEDRARVLRVIERRNPRAIEERRGNKIVDSIEWGNFKVELKVSSSFEVAISCHDDPEQPYILPSELLLVLNFLEELYGFDFRMERKLWKVVTWDLNRDFKNLRLEGVSCLTLQDVYGLVYKFYNKPYGIRVEVSSSIPIGFDSLYAWISGNAPPGLDRLMYLVGELKDEMKVLRAVLNGFNNRLDKHIEVEEGKE